MQYHHIQTLVKHLFDKDSFEQVSVQELKQFTDDYPFAAVGQFLYAKKLKDAGSYNHYEQSEQASLYFHNALWLRWLLNQKEEVIPVAARAEEAAQQPGFRIVVQMPKTVSDPQPAERRKEPVFSDVDDYKTNEPVTEQAAPVESTTEVAAEPETNGVHKEEIPVQEQIPVAEEKVIEDVQPAVEETAAVTVENAPATPEDTVAAVTAATEENAVAVNEGIEAASAVAIAEISQLAEENKAEAAVNAVSITEEVLTPVTSSAETAAMESVAVADQITTEQTAVADQTAAENIVQEEPVTQVTEQPIQVVEQVTPVEETVQTNQPVEETTQNGQPVEAAAAATEVTAQPEQAPVAETPAIEEKEAVAEPVAQIDQPVTEAPAAPEEKQSQPVVFTPASQEVKSAVDLGEPIFESYHTIDYFASQGIKLQLEDFKDGLGKQLKSFTDWLRSMKRIGPIENNTSLDEVTNQSIQRIAEHSVEEKEVLTEAMAEVWVKQGNLKKAIKVYEKLSLLNPAKSPYFAGRIEQLKAL